MKFKYLAVFLFLFVLTCDSVFSQENINQGMNDLSVRPIHSSDIMYKKRVWRKMDLKEVQNSAFFSNGRELSGLIIDAAKSGVIQPYESDTLGTPMAMEDFLENLKDPRVEDFGTTEEEGEAGGDEWGSGGFGDDFGDIGDDVAAEELTIDPYYLTKDIFVLELKEDVIFDKKRSRMYYDILTVKLIADASNTLDGIDKTIAVFSYKDLCEKVFKDNPEAIWFNDQNSAEHRNLKDAFELRLFASRIIKVSNTDDSYIADVYGGGKNTLYGSEWWEMKLMEFEHELWEF